MNRFTYFAWIIVLHCMLPALAVSQTDTLWNQLDAEGRKQGYWKKEYPGGGLQYRGYFENDQPVGLLQRFHHDGNLMAEMIHIRGTGTAYATLYNEAGRLAGRGKYSNMQKDSVWLYYAVDTSQLTYMETYMKGRKHGESIRYYSDGLPSEIMHWKNGEKDGAWKQFYEDSTLRLSTSYMRGVLHGEYQMWYPEGNTRMSGQYNNGKMDGTWCFYYDEEKAEKRLDYRNGELLNPELMEEWTKKYLEEVDSNSGKIPEVDLENFFEQK